MGFSILIFISTKNRFKEICLFELFSDLSLPQEFTVQLTGKSKTCLFENKEPLTFGKFYLQLKGKSILESFRH